VTKPARVALVGCGAVSRENLMPVLAGYGDVSVVALVDRDESRARSLAEAYGVRSVLTDTAALDRGAIDGVILATPPAHHAPATRDLAARGFHLLVEKPMAITAADARGMVDAADRAGVVLSVGLYRRFLPSVRLLRELIGRQDFGRVLSVDAEEGGPYGWQLATLDVLTRAAGGGGVLIDIGSHVIDVIMHVLGASGRLERYEDNSEGGIETDCVLRAHLDLPDGSAAPLRLELSRTRELRGSIRIYCEHAMLELPRASFTEVVIHRDTPTRAGSGAIQFSASWSGQPKEFAGYEAFRLEIEDWITAMAGGTQPMLSGRSVLPVVNLIETAYAQRVPLEEPAAVRAKAPAVVTGAARRRVLVTGAGGFLGGRTVELLREHGHWDPVPLVREPKGAARLARWPYEIRLGDVCSRADMDRVLRGVDAVVHCAVGTSWQPDEVRRVTVEGTRTVAEAALAAGVKRFVHISTFFVHRRDVAGTIDETVALEPPADDSYGQNKLAAERAVGELAGRGLSAVMLRPTRIYGPYSKTFTVRPLQALTEGRLAVGGNAGVPANMVYVDNVVEAIERALDAPDAFRGTGYLVTDTEQVSLREFYDFFGAAIGASVKVLPDWRPDNSGGPQSLLGSWVGGVKTVLRSPELRGIVRRVIETDPIGTVPRKLWNMSPNVQQSLLRRFGADAAVVYRGTAGESGGELVYQGEPGRVTSARAAKDLGFAASIPRADAMALTLEWARYARVLGHPAASE
jgi:predicted dehydrogenase/nucleoside-diphosphate-sugar epimerase